MYVDVTKKGKMKLETEKKCIYTEEELENIADLCLTLKKIRARLKSEGFPIDELSESITSKE